ncbi:MAG TPA: MarR family transcriptional regulator [Steroidobacteraceae bacterium]|nr:MarR family transcriptional regulator [Steroidobacteraceae bacterium]
MKIYTGTADAIARVRAQWKAERPDLDTRPMETIGRILRIQFLAGARIRRQLQRHGIDAGGFDVLATLRRAGSPHRMTPTGLYKELVLTSGAMTNRIDVLEQAGLVLRHPDPADRRGTLIELTREGMALVDRAMKEHMEGEAAMAAHLTKEEQRDLAGLLQKLLIGMEGDHEGA